MNNGNNDSSSFWGRNKHWIIISTFSFLALFTLFCITKRVQVEAGHEIVITDKPFWTIFSKGGVRDEPYTTGSIWLFITSDFLPWDVRPIQYTETFDDTRDGTITADNIPIDFNAYIKVRPIPGKTPRLNVSYGPDWYKQNLKEKFRTAVRDEVAKTPMTALTTRQFNKEGKDILGEIQRVVLADMNAFLIKTGIDAEVLEVIVGKATPPKTILDSLAETAAQEQRSKTERKRAAAELDRSNAETNRATADNAYRNSVGFTSDQFLQLEIAKKQVEAIQACGIKENCTAIIGQLGVQSTVPLK